MNQRATKLITQDAVGAFLRQTLQPGGSVCLGGLFKQNRPVALVRELIRTGIGELLLFSSPGSGYDVDLMIAAGLVAETFLPAVTLETRMCSNFRDAVEKGRIRAHAVDALTIVGGLTAAASGLPFYPVAAWHGSDVTKINPLITPMTAPFGGETLHAVKPIRPDLVLLHAQEGDEYGNIRHLTTMTYSDALMARAGTKVIVSVDRIVPTDAITRAPRATTVPCIYVDAVVELPFGAHPTGSFPHYSIDETFIDSFADISDDVRRDPAARPRLDAYLAQHVHQPRDIFDYLDGAGGYRRMAELEREARFL
jgi:glutaconate CoA-transferase subunit A